MKILLIYLAIPAALSVLLGLSDCIRVPKCAEKILPIPAFEDNENAIHLQNKH